MSGMRGAEPLGSPARIPVILGSLTTVSGQGDEIR
jgi:hypothetical protein